MIKNFTLIIPLLNEEEIIEEVLKELFSVIETLKLDYEVIIVDDGSSDNTLSRIKEITKEHNLKINLIRNQSNKGQSYSINIGIKASKFKNIITLDGDAQNDPNDIKLLLDLYDPTRNIHFVSGIRSVRKDSMVKKLSSYLANKIRKNYLKDNCDDTGCALKLFNKEIYEKLIYFDGIHRFLPALFLSMNSKNLYAEVNHRNRTRGKSKYGISNRLIPGLIDMYKVKKMMNQNLKQINNVKR